MMCNEIESKKKKEKKKLNANMNYQNKEYNGKLNQI